MVHAEVACISSEIDGSRVKESVLIVRYGAQFTILVDRKDLRVEASSQSSMNKS